MKRFFVLLFCLFLLLPLVSVSGCGKEKEPSFEELVLGSWNRYNNKAYTILFIRANGGWESDVRIEGSSSRIVKVKGKASGTWIVGEGNLILTVIESNIEGIWEKEATLFLEIMELNKDFMRLRYPNQRIFKWKRAQVKKKAEGSVSLDPVARMKPLVVNLNKIRSHDKDRYLCLNLDLELYDLMPDETVPIIHPEVREASIVFLSSLIYKDVKTLEDVKFAIKKLEIILSPYLNDNLKGIKVNHVVISTSYDKVEEFLIEHTPVPETASPEGEAEEKK